MKHENALRGMLFVTALLMMTAAFRIPDKPREEPVDRDGEMTAVQTPPPEPIPETDTWVRYSVPLEDELQKYINDLCAEKGIDPAIVYAVISIESDFDADKLGDGGESYGLMQIWQTAHTERCIRLGAYNLYAPRDNVRVGIDYLAELIGWGYGLDYALSFYNGHGGELPWWYVDEVHERAEQYAGSAVHVTE